MTVLLERPDILEFGGLTFLEVKKKFAKPNDRLINRIIVLDQGG